MKPDTLAYSPVELQNKLKRNFSELTIDDLTIINNDIKDMPVKVAYKLRKSNEEMNNIVEKL